MTDKLQEIREYIEKAPGFLEYSDAYDPATVLCEVWNMLRYEASVPAVALKVSACCGATIGYDAWVDGHGDVCGGPFDDSCCMGCSGENPTEVDAESEVTP